LAALVSVVTLAFALSSNAQVTKDQVIGSWKGKRANTTYKLILNADRTGSLNGTAVQWKLQGQTLKLATENGTYPYDVSAADGVLTLSGLDLKQPLALHRVQQQKPEQQEPQGLFSDTGAANNDSGNGGPQFPIAGNPPLTLKMVNQATSFFEWLLDAKLTVEQRKQLRNSLVQSWKARKKDDIQSTVAVIQFSEQVDQKPPKEQEAYRQALQAKYLEQMRAQSANPLAQWVLGIYDSAHQPIAAGNPPLTRQTVDAYAEMMSFMLRQAVGKQYFSANRQFKDALAQGLIARYSQMAASQQAAFAQLPALWALVQLKWPTTPQREKQQLRQQWRASLLAMEQGGNQIQAATQPSGNQGSSQSLDDMMAQHNEDQWVNMMAQSSMNTTTMTMMNVYHH
jgi:hypothetical protein